MIARFYLSPICTECLGDGFISLSNMYHRLKSIPGPIEVFYHHWPKYFDLLWPFVQHPRDDIIFTKLPAPSDLRIDSSLKERWRPEMFKHVKRDDYVFHSSRAYSKVICKIHPFIASELSKLDIGDDQLLLNCTELDQDVQYIEFKKKYDRKGHVTFQGHSINSEQQIRFEFDINRVLASFPSRTKFDVSSSKMPFDETLKLIGSAKLHIGIDSGPMHLALALGTPVIVCWDDMLGEKGLSTIYHVYANYREKLVLVQLNGDGKLMRFSNKPGEKPALTVVERLKFW